MKVSTWKDDTGKYYTGIEIDGVIVSYSRAAQLCGECPVTDDIFALLQSGVMIDGRLNALADCCREKGMAQSLKLQEGLKLCAPVPRPGAIYALGRNYAAHARESGLEPPDEPVVFSKAVTAVIAHKEPVIYQNWLSRVDPEVELAVVIGKKGYRIARENAREYIAGYTIINDVTARDMQSADLAKSHPWFRSKGIDTFCPMGPHIVTPDELPYPVSVNLCMKVNNEIRQQDNTGSMTFNPEYLVSWISRFHTLHAGDVISTGTPEGMHPVMRGDIMYAVVDGIGTLENPVVGE